MSATFVVRNSHDCLISSGIYYDMPTTVRPYFTATSATSASTGKMFINDINEYDNNPQHGPQSDSLSSDWQLPEQRVTEMTQQLADSQGQHDTQAFHSSEQPDLPTDQCSLEHRGPTVLDQWQSPESANIRQRGVCDDGQGIEQTFDLMPDLADLRFFDGDTFRASRMDWFACDTEFSDHQTMVSRDFNTPDALPGHGLILGTEPQSLNELVMGFPDSALAVHAPTSGSAPGQDQESENIYDNTSARVPAHDELDQSRPSPSHLRPGPDVVSNNETEEVWPAVLDRGGNEMWPFDYTSNKGFRVIKLPPLRQVLEDTVARRPAIEKATVLDLIKILSSPHIPSLNDGPILEALPAVGFLTKLVKIYFDEFHAVFPVIHVPTWKLESCSTPLLAAMACLGANHSTAEGSQDVAALLAEITQRALFWTGQIDTKAFRSTEYIAAMCFHHLYSLGLGNRRLYELAEASRSTMLASLRGMGVLSDSVASEDKDTVSSQVKHLHIAELERAWQEWREKEAKLRVAWTVFEFDCTIATMTGKRGVFSLNELPPRLPCSDSLWEAPTAKTWASILAFNNQPGAFYPLFQNLMASNTPPRSLPAWSKRLLAQALSRLHTDLKELEDCSMPSMLGLASLAESQRTSRKRMLAALSSLHDSLSAPKSTTEIVSMNIACLGVHYTHLIDGNQAMDLVIFLFRNSGRDLSPALSSELNRARQHLQAIFTRYPVDMRRAVSHAASVVAITRECPIFTPCETMRLFNAFAFLLAFTKLSSGSSNEGRPAIHLDVIPWQRCEADAPMFEYWTIHGGPACIGGVDVCDSGSFEALRDLGLKAMHELRVWGLARKFHLILQNFG
ncbi:uncharacterized protein A1O9_04222 [Exophiala aquamarina CBS 119918]|uniref:Xylanolytic transcriptional activator regulatory domain-containing protein n=1 Tax=Exophiala aquamarina CBS 119918 TaxID=1182545 RepID=A0A072PJ97_9EURO|nr:uncharacterized protein A1O9_04222 [Exophiala aquamarina CBS 119918]KEF59378.1 hypothetical protein A1O9_04222 [Exophiala aquamarina CBS 119918]